MMSHSLAFKLKPRLEFGSLSSLLLAAALCWPSPWLMAQGANTSLLASQPLEPSHSLMLMDEGRQRAIPIAIYLPQVPDKKIHCAKAPCPVAILSAGYGLLHTDYGFLAASLTKLGYLVVAVGHELPVDPPLSISGNLFETRKENWQRGAQTLRFVRQQLESTMTEFDFDKLLLIGHSNGGDISAWLANEMTAQNEPGITTLITLDSRRVPLPKTASIKLLSIRGSDFPADEGVLPTENERQALGLCITTIPQSRHNDMYDGGPVWLNVEIQRLLQAFLTRDNPCR